MILKVDLANLRHPDFLRRAQKLLREVIHSYPHPIVGLKHHPGMAFVEIIMFHGHLKAKNLPHHWPVDIFLSHHGLSPLKGLSLVHFCHPLPPSRDRGDCYAFGLTVTMRLMTDSLGTLQIDDTCF